MMTNTVQYGLSIFFFQLDKMLREFLKISNILILKKTKGKELDNGLKTEILKNKISKSINQ